MEFFNGWFILFAAFLLDFIFGDPQFAHHPIRYMGKAIERLEPHFRKWADTGEVPSTRLLIAGGLFAGSLIFAAWGLTFLAVRAAGAVHPACKICVEILLVYFCISARCLQDSAMDVYHSLTKNDLPEARRKVSLIVGRETANLSEAGVTRAAVETVAENLVDGVISPLFFAAIGGAPLATAYKMVNTLDSMIGYKNEKYEHFGKVAARIDDGANFIPARLSVPLISLAAQSLSGKGVSAFKTAVKQGAHHASPNSGYSEAAFAGTLGVKLGGPNYYHGKLVSKPYIGTEFGEAKPEHIRKACDLMMLSSFFCLVLFAVIN
jgi:adenosylcobinamide-phosphate synthase